MQKRYQVLIPDWLEKYIQWGVKKYGLSFSELIRLEICQAVLAMMHARYPEYKPGYTTEEFLEGINKFDEGKMGSEELDKILSTIYFEARKAIEYRFAQEKIKKNGRSDGQLQGN